MPRAATLRTTFASAGAEPVIESYLVEGMGHAWPGPAGDGLYTDPAGPDAAAITWDFAKRHPMS